MPTCAARSILSLSRQEVLLQWAGERVMNGPGPWFWGHDARAMGVLEAESGKIIAVAVFNDFHRGACEAHFASDGRRKWATYSVLRGLFHYIFLALGVRRVIASTPETNLTAVNLMKKMGFTIEGTLRTEPDGSKKNVVGQMFNVECAFIADLVRKEDGKA